MPAEALSSQDLMALMGLANRPAFLLGYIRPALDAGVIEMTLPDKPRSSKQKYRLTPAGRTWQAEHQGEGKA